MGKSNNFMGIPQKLALKFAVGKKRHTLKATLKVTSNTVLLWVSDIYRGTKMLSNGTKKEK